MNTPNIAFADTSVFRISEHVDQTSLFTASEAANAENALLDALDRLPDGGLLRIDFANVRISSEAARQLLRRALLRVTTGELKNRFIVLGDLGDSFYNVQIMLEGERLVAVEQSDDEGPQLRGDVDPAVRATYSHLLSVPNATASSVQTHFSLSNISTATNRLTTLSKLGLARRIDNRPVAGGGREFVYVAVQ
jgi:hypothetical protein